MVEQQNEEAVKAKSIAYKDWTTCDLSREDEKNQLREEYLRCRKEVKRKVAQAPKYIENAEAVLLVEDAEICKRMREYFDGLLNEEFLGTIFTLEMLLIAISWIFQWRRWRRQ